MAENDTPSFADEAKSWIRMDPDELDYVEAFNQFPDHLVFEVQEPETGKFQELITGKNLLAFSYETEIGVRILGAAFLKPTTSVVRPQFWLWSNEPDGDIVEGLVLRELISAHQAKKPEAV